MDAALRKTEDYWVFGFCVAVFMHLSLFCAIFFRLGSSLVEYGRPIVYSVSIEGGKNLGGRTQVPLTEKATPIAPPKNVSSAPAVPEKAEKSKPEDAEVSLAKKTPAPTPKATPRATSVKEAKVKPTPVKKTPSVDPDKEYQRAMQRYLGESADAGGKGFGAAALGGRGMGGGMLASPEFIAYLNLLKSHVHKGWRWYDRSSRYRTRVYFRILRDGAIRDIRMIDSSGSREFDDSVLRALAKADPVPPPPEKVYNAFKEVRMIFDPQELE